MIEVRDGNHIALLFVDDRSHKNGIAKKLIALAIEREEYFLWNWVLRVRLGSGEKELINSSRHITNSVKL